MTRPRTATFCRTLALVQKVKIRGLGRRRKLLVLLQQKIPITLGKLQSQVAIFLQPVNHH